METLTTPGGEKLLVLTEDECEDLIDARDARVAEREIASGRMETFSEDEVRAYIATPSPLAFWRQWRGVDPRDLARFAGVSDAHLAELEAGRSVADVLTYARLARRLRTSIESLIPTEVRESQAAAE